MTAIRCPNGAVLYRLSGPRCHGTLTVTPVNPGDPRDAYTDPIEVAIWIGDRCRTPTPAPPVEVPGDWLEVNGIALACEEFTVTPDQPTSPDHGWGLNPRRHRGHYGEGVPRATEQRFNDIVHAVITNWRTRYPAGALRQAWLQQFVAPIRAQHAEEYARTLTEKILQLAAERDEAFEEHDQWLRIAGTASSRTAPAPLSDADALHRIAALCACLSPDTDATALRQAITEITQIAIAGGRAARSGENLS